MANIDIDTTSGAYQQKLNALAVIRADIVERMRIFKDLPEPRQRQWLQRDPLLKNVLKFSRALMFHLGADVAKDLGD